MNADQNHTDDLREEPIDTPEQESIAIEDLEAELNGEIRDLHDRLLRLQAEFDNYRKRESRERAAAWGRAKGDLAQKLLGALDDLNRVAHLDPSKTSAAAVIDGVELVEKKLQEALLREGLEIVGEPGERFDPEIHEAIGMWPAPSPEQAGTVAVVAIRGYKFGNRLLRPAQVQVYQGDGGSGAEDAGTTRPEA